jgi:CheY-like chemotaxis protein
VVSQGKRILCIEDNSEAATLIAEDLRERGYVVTIARDGHSGFMAILQARPDLVLCDVNMPDMGGFEVLESLRALAPTFGPVPFIFLTASADRDAESKGRRLRADDYLTKSIDFEHLAAIIARLSQGPRREIWYRPNLEEEPIPAQASSSRLIEP